MTEKASLKGETVLFTGTKKSLAPFKLVEAYGGIAYSFPLIQTTEVISKKDRELLESCNAYDWLIFTSQSAVKYFGEKMQRFQKEASYFSVKIAAVGTQTAAALERLGFTVEFIPTVFSADTFVQQFRPIEKRSLRVLFIRGTLASSVIKQNLPFQVSEWTIYATEKRNDSIDEILHQIQTKDRISILFASPSAVRVFVEEVVSKVGWSNYTVGAIGHVTEQAIRTAGGPVHVKPEVYTLQELVHTLAKRKEV